MEFKHELEQWVYLKSFAETLIKIADFNIIQEINKCRFYEYDGQAAEEYCHYPTNPPQLDGTSHIICPACPCYEVRISEVSTA